MTKYMLIKLWQKPLIVAALALLLVLLLAATVSASLISDPMWVTICHTPPGHPEQAQTMVIHWSTLDKCLSHFDDFMGPCP